jgi:SAM-dependent methyltransferase
VSDAGLSEHARRNQRQWTRWSERYRGPGERAWREDRPRWGIWQVPEDELHALPAVRGKRVLELGCGTAYWSAWLARRGAHPIGLDLTAAQLATARGFQREFALEFPLVRATAEALPLCDGCIDVVVSEYGASIWCDPHLWVPEAARVLRPGGELVFLVNAALLMLCVPDEADPDLPPSDRLVRDYFGMHRFEWKSDESVEFHLTHSDWIHLLRDNGFALEDLLEIRAPADSPEMRLHVPREWARRWPTEEVWRARKLTSRYVR